MNKALTVASILILYVMMSGCSCGMLKSKNQLNGSVATAHYTSVPLQLDGKLDDAIWQNAQVYSLNLPQDKLNSGMSLQGQGKVQFAWDNDFFYIAASFQDSDIIAQGKEDNMYHYQYGDLCEVFLKPANESYYWELYVTPAGKKTSFFYPSRGYSGLPSCIDDYKCNLKVAAQCQGTLNNWHDKDISWTAEMAMPIKDLQAYGAQFIYKASWKILVGRYNYSRYLDNVELSMAPQISKTRYDLYEEYADLELVR